MKRKTDKQKEQAESTIRKSLFQSHVTIALAYREHSISSQENTLNHKFPKAMEHYWKFQGMVERLMGQNVQRKV